MGDEIKACISISNSAVRFNNRAQFTDISQEENARSGEPPDMRGL